MPLKIKCPTCKRVLSVPVQRVGAIVRCPVCEKKLRVPKTRHSKAKDSDTDEKRSGARRERARPAYRSSKPRPSREGPPRVKRDPPRAPEAKQQPEPPKKVTPDESPPARPESPPAAEAAPPPLDSSKKAPPSLEPPDPPKPPPLSRSKRKRRELPPDSSPAELRSDESKPEEREATSDADESGVKAEPKKQRWLDEQDQRPLPDRPPLPPKVAERGQAEDDSPSGARTKPPQVPSRPEREKAHAKTTDTAAEEPDREVVRGYEHDVHRRRTVYYLGAALILTALFSVIPAVTDIFQNLRALDPPGVSRWAFALLLASAVQLAYAIYLMQLPDWSTAWVVSLFTLATATGYATLLFIAILAKSDNQVIQLLELADNVYGKKAAGWCLIMLSISSLLAYFSGRISVRWHRAYDLATRTAKEQ